MILVQSSLFGGLYRKQLAFFIIINHVVAAVNGNILSLNQPFSICTPASQVGKKGMFNGSYCNERVGKQGVLLSHYTCTPNFLTQYAVTSPFFQWYLPFKKRIWDSKVSQWESVIVRKCHSWKMFVCTYGELALHIHQKPGQKKYGP